MCHLIDWAPQLARLCNEDPQLYDCRWELIQVPESAVEAHLDLGDVIAGDNDLGLDEDCKERGAAFWASTKEVTAAAVLGALTAAYWIDQEREDPTSAPASPILP